MRFGKKYFIWFSSIILFFICNINVVLAGGEGAENAIVKRVSAEGLTGLSLFVVNLYNDNRLVLAIITTLTMGAIGAIIAYITDKILKLFGLQVTKIQHLEH